MRLVYTGFWLHIILLLQGRSHQQFLTHTVNVNVSCSIPRNDRGIHTQDKHEQLNNNIQSGIMLVHVFKHVQTLSNIVGR